jgi:putative ABC transport system permease protein
MGTMAMAWRNALRHRGRTALSASAAFASTLIVCFIMSMESGYIDDMIANVKNHQTGDIRIMNAVYVENERAMPVGYRVANTERAIGEIESLPEVERAIPKTAFFAAIYRKGERIPCRAIGVDFRRDPIVRSRNDVLVEGSYPEPASAGILVTAGLARELSLGPGGKITALARTATGGANGKTFTVTGVVEMSDMDFSGRAFFLDWKTAGEFLRIGDDALAVLVFLREDTDASLALPAVRAAAERAGEGRGQRLDARTWDKVSESFAFLKISRVLFAVYGAVFYLLASTVIFNTTTMSVLERKREIGTLAALGMTAPRVMGLFLAESGIIASLGTLAGLVVGGTIVAIVGAVGFDVEAIYGSELGGMGISRVIYPSLAPAQAAFIFALALAISLAACVIPALMATRIEPASAIADR